MSHSAAGEPPSAGRRAGCVRTASYTAAEWELLTRLPARVIVAATEAEPSRPPGDVYAGLAGLEAIAAGRFFDSDLVRAVVISIYAEPDEGRPDAAGTDPASGYDELFASCRAVVRLLADRADPADSAAYRQWVRSVAARVGRTAGGGYRSPAGGGASRGAAGGGFRVAAGDPAGATGRRFADRLGGALGLT